MGKKTYDSNDVSYFPKDFRMVLPDGYRIDTEYDDDYNEVSHLRGGFYINDDGEEDFGFSCSFMKVNTQVEDRESLIKEGKLKDHFVPGLLLEEVATSMMEAQEEQFGKGVRLNLYNSFPASTIMKYYKPITIFGSIMETYVVFYLVEITEDLIFGINSVYRGQSEESNRFYKHLLNVIKAVRVNGKSIDIGKLTPKKLERALDMDADESVDPLDPGLKINLNLNFGDEEHQYTFNNDGSITDHSTGFKIAHPDEKLYPHYNSMLRTQNLGIPGATVVVNQTGTEYQFFSLKDDLGENASDEIREAVNRLTDTGAAEYKLADRAVAMRSLFHVNPDVFDPRHDRECELAEGLMHRAYMMSALRSFGWILSNCCNDLGLRPSELGADRVYDIIEAAASKDWLNYDDKTVCKGLCGTQDLHVYYLPDNTPDDVKAAFLPSQEQIEEVERIRQNLPSYNPILEQVGSLDELRKDLAFIGDAIGYIYDELKENRDYNQPLVGNDADILYAWCALAYAARGPFFTEDGPTLYFYSQIISEEERRVESERERKTLCDKWLKINGKYLEKDPHIDFSGKKFVFTGLGYRQYTMDDETAYAQLIKDRGGLIRSRVSGVTDYLIIEPAGAGEVKLSEALKQQSNGKPIKIILIDDLRKALGLEDSESETATVDPVKSIPPVLPADDTAQVTESIRLSKPGEKNSKITKEIVVAKTGGGSKTRTTIDTNKGRKKDISSTGRISLSRIPVAEVPENRKKLINGNKKEKYPVRFFYFFETGDQWEEFKNVFYYYCKKERHDFCEATENLYQKAVNFLDVFDDETKAELQDGLLRDTRPIHAFRSFIWTAVETINPKDKQSIGELSQEELEDLLEFITKHNYANYKPATASTKRFGAKFLRKEEVKMSCNATAGRFNIDFVNGFEGIYNKSSSIDLVELSYDLEELVPFMEEIFLILSGDCIESVRQAAEAVLQGWCIYAIHCRASFFSMPSKYAPDISNRSDIEGVIKADINPVSLDGNRYTVIDGVAIKMNDNRNKIIIPEGVKRIDAEKPMADLLRSASEVVFPSSFVGDIVFPDSLRKLIVRSNANNIHVGAESRFSLDKNILIEEVQFTGNVQFLNAGFSGCDHLSKVILPDSLEVIPFYMVSSCKMLKNIHLPDKLKEIQKSAFSNSGIQTLALPAGVESIEEDALDDQNSGYTVQVYKGSKSENALQEYCNNQRKKYAQLNQKYGTTYSIKMRILKQDAPWSAKAKGFIANIGKLYNNPEEPEILKMKINNMIASAFEIGYEEVKEAVLQDADGEKLTTLCNVLKDSDRIEIFKDKLPDVLATEIPAEAKKRELEKKHLGLTKEIEETEARITILESFVPENKEKLISLQKELEEKNTELMEKHQKYDLLFEKTKDEFDSKSKEIQEEISKSNQCIEKKQEELRMKQAELKSFSFFQFGKKKELNKIIQGLQEELENATEKRDRLVDEHEKNEKIYNEAISGPQSEISNTQKLVTDLNRRIDLLKNHIAMDEKELGEKPQKLASLKKELTDLETDTDDCDKG